MGLDPIIKRDQLALKLSQDTEQKYCNITMQNHLHRTQQHFTDLDIISGLDSKPTSSTWRCEN